MAVVFADTFYFLPFFFFFFFFFGPYLLHMEAPRLGGKSELQPPASATVTAAAASDLSRIFNLFHSPRQRQILNPLSEARGGTRILIDTSWSPFCGATTGTPPIF